MDKIIRNGVPYLVGTVEKIVLPVMGSADSIVEWITPDPESPPITTINCIDSDYDKNEHSYYFGDGSVITVKNTHDIQKYVNHIFFNILDSDGKTVGMPDPKSMKKLIKGYMSHGDKILYVYKKCDDKIPILSITKF